MGVYFADTGSKESGSADPATEDRRPNLFPSTALGLVRSPGRWARISSPYSGGPHIKTVVNLIISLLKPIENPLQLD